MPSSEAELLSEQRLRSPASLWGTDFKGDDITVNALDSTKSSSFESQFNVGKCRTCTSPGEELNSMVCVGTIAKKCSLQESYHSRLFQNLF